MMKQVDKLLVSIINIVVINYLLIDLIDALTLSFKYKSAPFWIKVFTMASLPQLAATINAVHPYYSK